jgi:3-hydroxy-9,10-secoandrosta-1,3,5(10)-triene-9,17-dione monooxygenase
MAGAGLKPTTSLPSATDADSSAYAAMLARARALVPHLRDRASKT